MLNLATKINPLVWKLNFGWTLAGEYENCISATTQQPASQQKKTFFHVSRNRTDEPGLDELVEQFWSIEADGIQMDPEQIYKKQVGQLIDILTNSINHNSARYEIKLPWKSEIKLENIFYSALNQVKSLILCCRKKTIRQSWQTLRNNMSNRWKCKILNQTDFDTCRHTILWKISISPEKSAELQMQLQISAANRANLTFLQGQICLISFWASW